uniref:hypothetical protein n=1 Tax=Candidatus Cryptobacteroides bacterium TaxID=3085639 RepID=UPI0040266EB4
IKDGGKFHSKQIVRERLGKVVWLASDGKSGIFLFFPPPAEDLCPMIPSPIALTRSVAMTDACRVEVLMFFLTPKSLVRRYEK